MAIFSLKTSIKNIVDFYLLAEVEQSLCFGSSLIYKSMQKNHYLAPDFRRQTDLRLYLYKITY